MAARVSMTFRRTKILWRGLCENRLYRRQYEIDCDFDRSFGFDDGLSEKCIKELSIQQARAIVDKKLYLGGQIVRHYHDSLDYPGEIAAAIPGESFDFGFLSNSAE